MKKICPLCETENDEDARFCKECNEPLYNIKAEEKEFIEKERLNEEREDEWIQDNTRKVNSKNESSELLKAEEEILATEIMKEGKLPIIDLQSEGLGQVILKKGEVVHCGDGAILKEVKTVNLGYKGGSQGIS
ncbi:MAG: zinc ribbon domain-containing protein, partial [Candidatus Atribacteria bacterium]